MTAAPIPETTNNTPAGGSAAAPRPPLSFARSDIERRLGFPAGPFTQPGPVLPATLAVILTVASFAALVPLRGTWLAETFTQRGWVPYVVVAFFWWAMMILFIKSRKLRLQRRALSHAVTPAQSDFVLSPASVSAVLDRLYEISDEPRHFLLFARIQFALANLRNMGRVADVDEVLRSRAEHDEAAVESSYTVVRGLVWAVPVLGFIGTVLGLSQAIGAFSAVLNQTARMEDLKPALQSVTVGLATAFETTLHALVAALIVQLFMVMVRRSEERTLDEFVDYCDRQIISRLRLRQDDRPEPGQPEVTA